MANMAIKPTLRKFRAKIHNLQGFFTKLSKFLHNANIPPLINKIDTRGLA